MSRPSKRRRDDDSVSRWYPIPDPDENLRSVHSREGRISQVGSLVSLTVHNQRVSQSETQWQKTTTWLPQDDLAFALDDTGAPYDAALDAFVMDEVPVAPPKEKGTKSQVSKRPHVFWKDVHRATYLDEILRWAGRGDFRASTDCVDCVARRIDQIGKPEYRCLECLVPDLVCASCCLRRHRVHPLHRIQKWVENMFQDITLKAMGLTVQLNHSSGYCESPSPCHSTMTVLHTNGLHEVAFQYCGCSRTIPPHIQLLRRGFYPASQQIVKTCATFSLLDLLHKMALTTKASTYDFYRALNFLTCSTGMGGFKSRYRALMRMCLQWRHLKMLKWGGRGHDPSGPEGTRPGELAVRCPSCPYPGINLPEGWEDAPAAMQFLYTMFACMDANFRLKNQLVSNYSQDPGLGIGWAYMLPRAEYEGYVLNCANDADISTCVGFQAIAQANNRFSRGLRYTGVGGVFCGRSEMFLPNGIGNLQKGERFANMDFIFASGMKAFAATLLCILISYDISCQWFVNLSKRMSESWPEHLRFPPTTKLTPAIPKLHEPMHQAANHQVYSLNFIPGAGKSDFEAPERIWAGHNPVGNATKTQGPGSRHDVLDDNFGFWNWLKVIAMGVALMRKYRNAVADRNIQVEGHRGLTAGLDAAVVAKWEAMCVEWEKDKYPKTKKNPYAVEGVAMTEAHAKKELAAEEDQRLASGGLSLHATSAPAFLVMGLEIEETQRRLRRLARSGVTPATVRQEGGLAEQRTQLMRRIRVWEQLLPIYLPGLLQYQSQTHTQAGEAPQLPRHPEDIPLWLPSRLPDSERRRICVANLPEIEDRLRTAQCYDALDSIRHTLKIKARLVKFKNLNVRGQREGTRSRAIIDRVHEKARATAEKYRTARAAKRALVGAGDWEHKLRLLADADVRGYQDPNLLQPRVGRRGTLEDDQLSGAQDIDMDRPSETSDFNLLPQERTRRDGTGETHRTLSWIWITGTGMDDPENANDDILRAEWAKSRARSNRAKEEVMLIREEMRRTPEFLEYQSKEWLSRIGLRDVDAALDEGLQSYAHQQSSIQTGLANQFRSIWREPLSPTTNPPRDIDASSNPNATSIPTETSFQVPNLSNVSTRPAQDTEEDDEDEDDDDVMDDLDPLNGGEWDEEDRNLYV